MSLGGCINEYNRLNNLKKMYPYHQVEPAAGLIKDSGYQYIIVDTTGEIIAVSFYPFSDEKLSSFRNIR